MNEHDNNYPALSHRVAELERRMVKSEADRKEFFDRIRAIEKHEAVKAERLETLMSKVDNIQKNVDTLISIPGKRWNDIIDKVVFTIVGGIIAFLLSRLGL